MYDFFIPPVSLVTLASTPPTKIPYGVAMIGAELEWKETKGKGIKVAVMDTGKPEHPDLKIAGAFNFSDAEDEYDHHGHSTHVCGIIAADGNILGVAPEVELYTYKVLNDQGQGQWDWLARAIRSAADAGINVINMSLGGPQGSPALQEAVKYAYQKGVKMAAAAGNEGPMGVGYPAAYPEVISTAATDIKKRHPDFSSIGKAVEVAAAGVDVFSTYLGGRYAVLSGTSMASPHIAGAVAILDGKALIRFGRVLTPEETRLLLKVYSEDVGQFGPDPEFGFGVFSFGRLLGSDKPKRHLRFQIGNKKYWKNGQELVAATPPQLIQGYTMLHSRTVGEALDMQVDWIPPDVVEIYDRE